MRRYFLKFEVGPLFGVRTLRLGGHLQNPFRKLKSNANTEEDVKAEKEDDADGGEREVLERGGGA